MPSSSPISPTAAGFDPSAEPELESVARLRAVIARLARRLRPTVAGSELTPSQISVLFTIVRLGPLGPSELAEIEAMNPTMVSRVIAHLCTLGLIERESKQDDRRAATVSATEAGRRLREEVQTERTLALREYVHGLDESQRGLLWEALPILEELAEQLRGRGR